MGKKQKVVRKAGNYSPEFRLEVVKLHLDEGYSIVMLAEEFGCGKSTISKWVKTYNEHGDAGLLQPATRRKHKCKTFNKSLQSKIIELKKDDPQRGVRRISDILKRFFLVKASPETVRNTLHEAKLIEPPPKKRKRNISKPRRFERATPNQMWQTDICTFRLAGKNAYLLGYIDDYSRYVAGMGLYRSQTAANLLEVYRTAIGEYGVPREMLTDNGRQYTNWRGTTNFEKELKRDRVKHIKSRPHHPMTLGKIERFWKTILAEFLFRSQFDSFENARERLALWVKYYNYKRPHQGIGGLCPADRFFEVQSELKHTLEKGIEENALEVALRGKPQRPFYMVGRLGNQNVAIRAEKGKIKMHVDDSEHLEGKELVYDLNMENNNGEAESIEADSTEKVNQQGGHNEQCELEKVTQQAADLSFREVPGCTISLDGELFDQRSVPGFISDPCSGNTLAGDCHGSDAAGSGSAGAQGEKDAVVEPVGEVIERTENQFAAASGRSCATGEKLKEDPSDAENNHADSSRTPHRSDSKGPKRRIHSYCCRR